jgi:NADH:ubiquinone oxidoreductase subunit C
MSTATANPLQREEDIVKKLHETIPENMVKEIHILRRSRIELRTAPENIVQVATLLRDKLGYDYPNGVSAVDYMRESRFEILYHLLSTIDRSNRDILFIVKESTPRNIPKVPSLVSIWPGVENYERECFEMFGITFEGHPKLEKLFLNDNWEGPPPLRKDIRFPTD